MSEPPADEGPTTPADRDPQAPAPPRGEALPEEVREFVNRAWKLLATTWAGIAVVIAVVYALPYGLGFVALGTQIADGGEFAIVAFAALIAASFASSVPAPTPALGTLSIVLAAILGANFEPILTGLVAGVAQTAGLATSYGAGAAGLAPAITARFDKNPTAAQALDRASGIVRRRGGTAMLLLALVPNPLYAFASVFAGAARMGWYRFLGAALVGGVGKFMIAAFLGERILD